MTKLTAIRTAKPRMMMLRVRSRRASFLSITLTFRGRNADCKGHAGQLTAYKTVFTQMSSRCYFTALHRHCRQLNVAVAGIQYLHCHDVEPGPRPLYSQSSHHPVQ